MAYNSEKETTNPFLPKVKEKWKELIAFDGDSIIEIVVKSISVLIVLCIIVLLIPIGIIISIYNSFYNLQKKAYDDLKYDTNPSTSQFVSSVEFGIYTLLSLPFFLILVPYWLFAIVVTWFAKHKVVTIVVIVLIIVYMSFKDEIHELISRLI